MCGHYPKQRGEQSRGGQEKECVYTRIQATARKPIGVLRFVVLVVGAV
jgi:hypothetical protein